MARTIDPGQSPGRVPRLSVDLRNEGFAEDLAAWGYLTEHSRSSRFAGHVRGDRDFTVSKIVKAHLELWRAPELTSSSSLRLSIIHSGSTSLLTEAGSYRMEPGDSFLSKSAGEARFSTRSWVRKYVLAIPAVDMGASDLDGHIWVPAKYQPEAKRLFLRATDLILREDKALPIAEMQARRRVVQALGELWMQEYMRGHLLQGRMTPGVQLLSTARELIELYATDATLTVTRLATMVGVSDRHLRRVFADADDSPLVAITRVRLKRARELAEAPLQGAEIERVSALAGFPSVRAFRRALRRVV